MAHSFARKTNKTKEKRNSYQTTSKFVIKDLFFGRWQWLFPSKHFSAHSSDMVKPELAGQPRANPMQRISAVLSQAYLASQSSKLRVPSVAMVWSHFSKIKDTKTVASTLYKQTVLSTMNVTELATQNKSHTKRCSTSPLRLHSKFLVLH